MSGVALQISEVKGMERVRSVLNKMSYFQIVDLLDNVGAVVENQVRRRIVRQEGPPEGGRWEPYKWGGRYIAWKTKIGKGDAGFLRLYGDLVDSLTHNVGTGKVDIGSNRVYTATMQLGSKDGTIPARPLLGLSDDNKDEVERAINTWLKETIGV
jgi:phage virion morphogenesis protein